MSTAEFLFAVLALLATPGPTNTLLALSGAIAGLRPSLRLIPAEAAGYLVVVAPLAVFGAELLAAWPAAGLAVKLAAAVWVMALAAKLWRAPDPERDGGAVTARRVFVTTALNPKGLIFGLVLLPAAPEALGERLGLFVLTTALVALAWIAAGAVLKRGEAAATPALLRRAAACWLALLSLGLAAGTLSA